jgi:hypothetical protein
MNLCHIQVEKCVTDVRRNCRNIYNSSSDVWWDFNSRKIQPEYYSFVLRKTGLTPNQAENTCLLLDRNTYGSSFSAVSGSGSVSSEYDSRVGAYNGQIGNTLVKNNPQGVAINTSGKVDASRGHYARWDAATGECLIRVAAYNKDSHIKNNWLFGTLGDDKPAEVWKAAGETFSCNKDLFGFSLMNDTSTVAVVGIGGGTLVGAGVGAIAGHGKRDFDCKRGGNLKKLTEELRASKNLGTINMYLDPAYRITAGKEVTEDQCGEIVKLYDKYLMLKDLNKENCSGIITVYGTWAQDFLKKSDGSIDFTKISHDGEIVNVIEPSDDIKNKVKEILANIDTGVSDEDMRYDRKSPLALQKADRGNDDETCTNYHPLNKIFQDDQIVCTANSDCISGATLGSQLNQLDSDVFRNIAILQGEKSNMLSSTLTGAAIGAGAGGLATAITAFVEKSNINCRIGDGLDKVSFGKSHSIGTLKDFYVKWNLHLPDTIMPTAQVSDCASWKSACGTLKDLNQCVGAQINYRPAGVNTMTLVNSACAISGSVCIENYPVAKSQGACE